MPVIRVKKETNYTVMDNFHLRDPALSLKAKGLLSLMLSLPEGWEYSLGGLAAICREGRDAIRTAANELEKNGYLRRFRVRNPDGSFSHNIFWIYEHPGLGQPSPDSPPAEDPMELSKDINKKRLQEEEEEWL